jgi:hypothetical protein
MIDLSFRAERGIWNLCLSEFRFERARLQARRRR